jgi:hypothetical protein
MIVAKFSDLSFRAKRSVVEESLTVIRSGFQTVRDVSTHSTPLRARLPLEMTKDESVGVANAHPSFPIASVGQTSMARSAAAISSCVSGCLGK